MNCLSSIVEALELDQFEAVQDIIAPFLPLDKHEDEDVGDKLLTDVRMAGFEASGKAWPIDKFIATQSKL